MFSLFLTAAAVVFSSFSAPHGECPDQIVVKVEQHIAVGPKLGCSSLEIQTPGVRISSITSCPAYVIIYPEHMGTRHQPDSNTFTRPTSTVDVREITFECKRHYILFIPYDTSCRIRSDATIGHFDNYSQYACAFGGTPR